ncbi:MAG: fimbrillin family protein [Muribaculaceae bacterium]|nr:fimbrillin family protein [Muribaculaceae bacterium]
MESTIKTSYIILGGLLLLSSCAQEDSPAVRTDGSDRRIVFHTALPELTTKAKEIATELPYFLMTAFDESDVKLISGDTLKGYFYNKRIEKIDGSNTYQTDECQWPAQGQESDILHFFAYYPALGPGATLVNATAVGENNTIEAIGYNIKDFSVASDVAEQVDFVTAYAKGSMAENLFSGISLNFRHQLSRIEVKAKGAHKSCDIQIAGVRIANAGMKGDFVFPTSADADEVWSGTTKGIAEYIFHDGDPIVKVGPDAVSIMGKKIGEDTDNCAMLIPSTYSGWDYSGDSGNENEGMYMSVLLRVLDKTPGGNNKQQYPYPDNSQSLNAPNISTVYLAVNKTNDIVTRRVYKSGESFFSDEACTQSYTIPEEEEVRAFGWASLPITGEWESGYTYTYTLDYTSGVGVHGPEVTGETSPKAGDPIIGDRVGVSVAVSNWQSGSTTDETVPGS